MLYLFPIYCVLKIVDGRFADASLQTGEAVSFAKGLRGLVSDLHSPLNNLVTPLITRLLSPSSSPHNLLSHPNEKIAHQLRFPFYDTKHNFKMNCVRV